MKDFFFDRDEGGNDVGVFVASLGEAKVRILEDLSVIAEYGPSSLGCEKIADGVWEYQQSLGQGRRLVLLFDFVVNCDAYIALHGFRAGPEGTRRSDLRIAQSRRKKYPR